MDPVTAILSAAALAGGILGGQRKQIDVNWLRQHFGPEAVSKEALDLFNNILNSPHGQALMANAAEQGQQFGRNVNKGAAEAGLTGPGGADTGAGLFATSAAQGATDSFQRGVQSNIYQSALPAAQEMVQGRMQAYLNDRAAGGAPTNSSRFWSSIGNAAGTVGAMLPQQSPLQKANTGMTGPLAPQLQNPIPGGEDRIKAILGQAGSPVLNPLSKAPRFSSFAGAVRPYGSPTILRNKI